MALTPTLIFGYPTLAELVPALAVKLNLGVEEACEDPEPEVEEDDGLDDLSEDDARQLLLDELQDLPEELLAES